MIHFCDCDGVRTLREMSALSLDTVGLLIGLTIFVFQLSSITIVNVIRTGLSFETCLIYTQFRSDFILMLF